jgi:hypothetical protein
VAATRARDILVFLGFDPTYADKEWVQKSWLSPLWGAHEGYVFEALTAWEQEKTATIQRAVPSVVIRGPKEAGKGCSGQAAAGSACRASEE